MVRQNQYFPQSRPHPGETLAEKLEEMQVSYRLSRQAAISAELLDLIAGYQAATGE